MNPISGGLIAGFSVLISMMPYISIAAVPVWHFIFYIPISIVLVWFYSVGLAKDE